MCLVGDEVDQGSVDGESHAGVPGGTGLAGESVGSEATQSGLGRLAAVGEGIIQFYDANKNLLREVSLLEEVEKKAA